jgi:hypothetical protein
MEKPSPFSQARLQFFLIGDEADTADHRIKPIQNGTRKIVTHRTKLIQKSCRNV